MHPWAPALAGLLWVCVALGGEVRIDLIDLPLRIANNGFQNVPDYRLHGGLSWRF